MPANLSQPEPPPVSNNETPVWELVIRDMQERDAEGRRKYGTPLQPHNGRDVLVDAYQEALDLVVYLRQTIEERRASLPRYHWRVRCPNCQHDWIADVVAGKTLGFATASLPDQGCPRCEYHLATGDLVTLVGPVNNNTVAIPPPNQGMFIHAQ